MLLVVDNGSVYTDSIIETLKDSSTDFDHATFEKIEGLGLDNYSSIILSGRRKNNPAMNVINSGIIRHAVSEKKPFLGICYGAEILAITLGGTIRRMDTSRKGMDKVEVVESNPLCSGNLMMFESHSYKIARLGPQFKVLARSEACEFEMFQYGTEMIFGTQFHPEMSHDGRKLLNNFARVK